MRRISLRGPGFSREDRDENVRRVGVVAKEVVRPVPTTRSNGSAKLSRWAPSQTGSRRPGLFKVKTTRD